MHPKTFLDNVFPGTPGMFHRPITAKVLCDGLNDEKKSVILPIFGKIGDIDTHPAPQFERVSFKLQPYVADDALMSVLFAERMYGVNLDKIPASGDNPEDVQNTDPRRDGAPSR